MFRFFQLSLLFCRDWSYWWRYLLLGLLPIDASILIHFVLRVASLFYHVSLCVYFFCIGLHTLGLMSAKGHPHAQLIRAGPSSNPSGVSSLRVPLQLKGCTRTSSMCSSTTPLGASVLCAFSSRSALHFDHGVEQAYSAAARVLLACPSRTPPSSASSCLLIFLYEALPHAEGRRLRIHVSRGPFSLLLVLRLRH